MIDELARLARVVIVPEGTLAGPAAVRAAASTHRFHDVLALAARRRRRLHRGGGGGLGVPSVHEPARRGYIREQRYGLCRWETEPEAAVALVRGWLADAAGTRAKFAAARNRLLAEKEDPSSGWRVGSWRRAGRHERRDLTRGRRSCSARATTATRSSSGRRAGCSTSEPAVEFDAFEPLPDKLIERINRDCAFVVAGCTTLQPGQNAAMDASTASRVPAPCFGGCVGARATGARRCKAPSADAPAPASAATASAIARR